MRALSVALMLAMGLAFLACGGEETPTAIDSNPTGMWAGAVAGSVATQIQTQAAAATPEVEAQKRTPQQDQSQSTAQPPSLTQGRHILINGQAVTPHQMSQIVTIEGSVGYQIPDGQYWYDPMSGLWGLWGGPALGYLSAGMTLGGPLPPNASGGGAGNWTGVFINGREIHPTEVDLLRSFAVVPAGQYWLDGQGNFGPENAAMMFNIFQLTQQQPNSGGSWGHSTWTPGGNNYVGGDGEGFTYFMGSDGTTWYSN